MPDLSGAWDQAEAILSFRSIEELEVRELLRRWQMHESLRTIARDLGIDRKTVRRYVRVAEAMRLAATAPLDDETVSGIVWVVQRPTTCVSELQHVLANQAEHIRAWLAARSSLAEIHERLAGAGVFTSYATLRRFAIRELGWRRRSVARPQ